LRGVLVGWGLFFFVSKAVAFELAEHKAITERAVAELSICLKAPISKKMIRELISFNRREDLNLFRKWGRYSHYYDPQGKMLSRRASVELRLAKLEDDLKEDPDKAFDSLGGVIHYLQDMASPPHVIPIKHGASDGFESFDDTAFFDEPLSAVDCEELRKYPVQPWSDLLQETIKATLATMSQKVPAMIDGDKAEISWADFFGGNSSVAVGEYGVFGNKFGAEKFTIDSKTYQIQQADYAAYKRTQLLLAVSVTRRAIYYYLVKTSE
jgi:hypothetical protein